MFMVRVLKYFFVSVVDSLVNYNDLQLSSNLTTALLVVLLAAESMWGWLGWLAWHTNSMRRCSLANLGNTNSLRTKVVDPSDTITDVSSMMTPLLIHTSDGIGFPIEFNTESVYWMYISLEFYVIFNLKNLVFNLRINLYAFGL